MDPFRLKDFQINRLGYNFKNLDLLQEAMTHSLDQPGGDAVLFPSQNRCFSQRLQIIGNAVLKFTVTQYVIQTLDVTANEGALTRKKEDLIIGTVQKIVGEALFEPYANPKTNLFNYIRVNNSFRMNFNQNHIIPYEKLVRALMGAVYLDAGGISGDGMQAAFNLFLRIWGANVVQEVGDGDTTENLRSRYPAPSKVVLDTWTRKGVHRKFIQEVEEAIGVDFVRQHLLAEAITQKTFYEGVSCGQSMPDYERLEFLGDSVLGLIVTELLWTDYRFDQEDVPLDHKITALIDSQAQKGIYCKLGLDRFVRMKSGGIPGWSMQDDIVESIIGAVFLDRGGIAAKDFVLRTWGLTEKTLQPDLDDLQEKLGYKFRNAQFLTRSLGVLPQNTERSDHYCKVLRYIGKSWIQFHATEYTLRTCDPKDSVAALVHRRNLLCGETILLRIANYLNLSKYVTLTRSQINRGVETYMLYEEVIHALAGAIFKDMQEASIKMSFGNVFYRLWNPFLHKCPKKYLLENFPSTTVTSSLREWEVAEIEGNLRHTFAAQQLLEQALFSSTDFGLVRNNSGELSLIGEAALDLTVSVYVAILCCIQLDDPDKNVRDADYNAFHALTMANCLDLAQDLFDVSLLREYIDNQPGGSVMRGTVSNEELLKRIFGAIFVDMSASGKNADLIFSDWKHHFIIRCEFITDKPQED